MTVNITDTAGEKDLATSVSFEITLNTPASGRGLAVSVITFASSPPSAPTVRIEESASMTCVKYYSFDRGASYTDDRYCRISFFYDENTVSGSQTIFVSRSGSYFIAAQGYAVTGVDHVDTFSNGYGSGSTYCTRTYTAGSVGTVSLVASTTHGDDSEIGAMTGYSGVTVDMTRGDDTYPSHGIGHEHNASVSVSSGFSWSGQGNANWWEAGVILEGPAVSYYQLDATGATVEAEGGTAEMFSGVSLDATGAEVEAVGGVAAFVPPGTDFFCDTLLPDGLDNGTSWENAFHSFTHMVSHMGTGDRGHVKACTVVDIETTAVVIPDGVCLYGGYSRSLRGTMLLTDYRQWMWDQTIIDMDGKYTSSQFGCLITGSGADDVQIDGFYFRNCESANISGGAILVLNASNWRIYNCVFEDCISTNSGGAIAFQSGGSTDYNQILNCRFYRCEANASTGYGGAVSSYGGCLSVINTVVSECSAYYGGGISIEANADECLIHSSTISGCTGLGEGCGLYLLNINEDIIVRWSRISDSLGSHSAVSINNDSNYWHRFKNSIITGGLGAGIWNSHSGRDWIEITNCTIADNKYPGVEFDYYVGVGGVLNIYNSILWGNDADYGGDQIGGDYPASEVQYSDIQGGYTGTGNINVDPEFIGAGASEPYALGESTACVDGANALASGYEAVDITGFARDGTPDMGAIEYSPSIPGCIDCSRYHLDMGSKCTSTVKTYPSINFALPYLLQEAPQQLVNSAISDGRFPACFPLWMGGEVEIDNVAANLVESFIAEISGSALLRFDTLATHPSWGLSFPDSVRSTLYSDDGDAWKGTTGVPSHGNELQVDNNSAVRLWDMVRYGVGHLNSPSLTDALKVYSIWVEGHPQVGRDMSDKIVQWLYEHDDISDPDCPVSSAVMIEFVKLLNALAWETRNPLSCPVFGIYWPSLPDGTVV